jgi:hypothetical protein
MRIGAEFMTELPKIDWKLGVAGGRKFLRKVWDDGRRLRRLLS